MSTEIEQLIIQLVEAWNAYDVERVVSFYAPHCMEEDIAVAQPQNGYEAVRRTMTRYLSAFPDLRLDITKIVVEPPQAVLIWKLHAVHKGTLLNIPPTGREVVVEGSSLFLIENGHIQHTKRIWDLAGLLRSLGLLPDLK